MKARPLIHHLPFLAEHRPTFELIRSGRKEIETRAGSPAYLQIQPGDMIEFSCGTEKIRRRVKQVEHYKDFAGLFAAYAPQEINPNQSDAAAMQKKYLSFPGYGQRLKEYGILVFSLEEI